MSGEESRGNQSVLLDLNIIDGFTFYSFESFNDLQAEFKTENFIATTLPISLSRGNVGCKSAGSKSAKRPRKKASCDRENVTMPKELLTDCSTTIVEDAENKLSDSKNDLLHINNSCMAKTELPEKCSTKKDVTTSTSPILNDITPNDKMSGIEMVPLVSPSTSNVLTNGHNERGTSPLAVDCNNQQFKHGAKRKMENTKFHSQYGGDSDIEMSAKKPQLCKLTDNISVAIRNAHSACSGSLTNGTPSTVANRSYHILSPKEFVSVKKEIVSASSPSLPKDNSSLCALQSSSVSSVAEFSSAIDVDNSRSKSSASCASNFGAKFNGNFIGVPTTSGNFPCGSPTCIQQAKLHQHQHTHIHHYAPSVLPPFVADAQFGIPAYQTPLPTLPLIQLSSAMKNVLPNFHTPSPTATVKKKGRWCAIHVQIAWDIYKKRIAHHQSKRDANNRHHSRSSPYSDSMKPKSDSTKSHHHHSTKNNETSKLLPLKLESSNSISSGNSLPMTSSSSSLFSRIASTAEHSHSNYTGFIRDNRKEYRTQTTDGGLTESKYQAEKERHKNRTGIQSQSNSTLSVKDKHHHHRHSNTSVDGSIALEYPTEIRDRLQRQIIGDANSSSSARQNATVAQAAPPGGYENVHVSNAQNSAAITLASFSSNFYQSPRLTLPTSTQQQQHQQHSNYLDSLRFSLHGTLSPTGHSSVGARTAVLPLANDSLITRSLNGQTENSTRLQQQMSQQQQFQLSQQRAIDPLAALFFDAERSLISRCAQQGSNGLATAPLLPNGFMNNGGFVNGLASAGFEPPSALAMYAGLLQQERLEIERNRSLLLTSVLPRSALLTSAVSYPSAMTSSSPHYAGGGCVPHQSASNGGSSAMPNFPLGNSYTQQALAKFINAAASANPYGMMTLQQMAGLGNLPAAELLTNAAAMAFSPTAVGQHHVFHNQNR